VHGLIDQNTSTWNAPLINSIFFEEAASRSLHIPIVKSHDKDNLIWGIHNKDIALLRKPTRS
jgi:hypothetical protein